MGLFGCSVKDATSFGTDPESHVTEVSGLELFEDVGSFQPFESHEIVGRDKNGARALEAARSAYETIEFLGCFLAWLILNHREAIDQLGTRLTFHGCSRIASVAVGKNAKEAEPVAKGIRAESGAPPVTVLKLFDGAAQSLHRFRCVLHVLHVEVEMNRRPMPPEVSLVPLRGCRARLFFEAEVDPHTIGIKCVVARSLGLEGAAQGLCIKEGPGVEIGNVDADGNFRHGRRYHSHDALQASQVRSCGKIPLRAKCCLDLGRHFGSAARVVVIRKRMILRPLVLTSVALPLALACSPASSPSTGEQTTSGASGTGDGDNGVGDGDAGDGDGTGTGTGTGTTTSGGVTGDVSGGTGGGDGTSGGTSGTGTTTGSAPVDCSSLPVCDDFEGGAIDAGTWTNILGWGGEAPASSISLETSDSHSPGSSVLITPASAPIGISTPAPGSSLYLRTWIKVEGGGGGALFAVGDPTSHGDEIRLRVREGYITLNSAGGGDGLAPDPSGCTPDTCSQVPTDWFCAEMYFDQGSETATLWIDGTEAASVVGNVGWHSGGSFPTPGRVWFGSYAPSGSAPSGVYFDDIMVGTSKES